MKELKTRTDFSVSQFIEENIILKNTLLQMKIILDHELTTQEPELTKILKDRILHGGKLLRPIFFILSANIGNPIDTIVAEQAAGIELIHNATLFHDDVIDDSSKRRGLPTARATLGAKDAVLAGDFLLTKAFIIAARNVCTFDNKIVSLSHAVSVACSGEIIQDMRKFTYTASIRQYKRIIAGKTASLFSLACYSGAIAGNLAINECNVLRRIGYCIGMAFQILDDVLDYSKNDEHIKKPVNKDIKEGLCTLPLIFALKKYSHKLMVLLSDPPFTDENIHEVNAIILNSDCIELSLDEASKYTQRALLLIQELPKCKMREDLYVLVRELLNRSH